MMSIVINKCVHLGKNLFFLKNDLDWLFNISLYFGWKNILSFTKLFQIF